MKKTCFVVMGFGVKTDFETGRKYDLDMTYQNIIKPAVEAADVNCVRADEIVHAGMIDKPMYDQILRAELLSQTYGSQGGTYRDAGDFERAIECYDQCYKIELERITQCQHKDSYNLLQRLVVRILHARKVPSGDEAVHGLNMCVALDDARKEIERQVFSGRNDSWALADLALVRFLSGQDAEQAIRDLEGRKSDASFYESTLVVVEALIKEGLGGTALGERLERFGRLLRRKGGMK